MDFIQAPRGCRHAQLTQHFAKVSTQASGGAVLEGICHGGCDVCDARLASLRDLSAHSRQVLQIIADAATGVSEQQVLEQLVCRWP